VRADQALRAGGKFLRLAVARTAAGVLGELGARPVALSRVNSSSWIGES
jgi:hypothetical protein